MYPQKEGVTMVKFTEDDEDTKAVTILAEDYKADLDTLRNLTPAIITEVDVQLLQIMANKYDVDVEVSKSKFVEGLGKVANKIRTLLEDLAIEHVLESEKEDKPGKKPKKKSSKKETLPESISKR